MKTNSEKLGIAVWGLGRHALKNVLPAIIKSSHLKLRGVHTRQTQKAIDVANQYDCEVWSNADDMLQDTAVDIIYLATATGLHFEQGKQVLCAGKHLVCEKSLTHEPEQSLALIDLAEQKQRILCEAFMYQYHPQFQQLKRLVKHANFGKVSSIACYFGIPESVPPGFRAEQGLGGGALLDVGGYTLSAVLQLLDEVPQLMLAEVDYQSQAVDITGVASLRFGTGQHAYVNWGYNRAYQAQIQVWGQQQSIFADKIFSKPDNFSPRIMVRNQFGDAQTIEVEAANSFVCMFATIYEAYFNLPQRLYLYHEARQQAELMRAVMAGVSELNNNSESNLIKQVLHG